MNIPRGRRSAGGLGTPKASWPNEDMAQPNTTSECYTMNRKRGFTLIELLTDVQQESDESAGTRPVAL